MLLALLLAAVDDAVHQRGRRAALHELAQRLLPTERPRGPSVTETIVLAVRAWAARPEPTGLAPDASLRSVAFHIFANEMLTMIHDAIGDPEAMGGIDDMMFMAFVGGDRTQDPNWGVYLPKVDRARLLAHFRTGTPFVPVLRTEFDPLFAAAVHQYARHDFRTDIARVILMKLRSIHDWVATTHPDLTGLDYLEMLDRSNEWHRQLAGSRLGTPIPPALVVLRWPDGWTLQRLTEKADLAREGESMGHCVGGPDRGNGRRDGESEYWQMVRDDQGEIFSLRDPAGVPFATLEVNKLGRVCQVHGPRNEAPTVEAMVRLREAMWRLKVFSRQPRIHRIGESGVWSDADIEKEPDYRAAKQSYSQALGTILEDGGLRPDAEGTIPAVPYHSRGGMAAQTALAALGRLAGTLGEGAQFNDEVSPQAEVGTSPAIPISCPVGWMPLRGLIVFGDADRNRPEALLLVPIVGKDGVEFLVYPVTEPGAPAPKVRRFYVLVDAVRAATGVPKHPPDVSHIEMFPGLGMDWGVSPWDQARYPVAAARKMRAAQAASLNP